MNINKSIIVYGSGVEKRCQIGEKDRERLRVVLQVVDDHAITGRVDIGFIETKNFVFFDKNIFRRMVEGSYEVMHWELKKALQYISYQEEMIANQKLIIVQKNIAMELAWRASRKTYELAQEYEARARRAESKLKQADMIIENLEDRLSDAEDDASCGMLINGQSTTTIRELQSENEELKGEVFDRSCELDETKSELEKMREAYEEEKRSRAAEKAEYEQEIARLKAELAKGKS